MDEGQPTCDVRGSGQREDQGSVQLLRLGRQHRLGVVEEARELRLHFRTPQSCDEPQGRALHAEVRRHTGCDVKGRSLTPAAAGLSYMPQKRRHLPQVQLVLVGLGNRGQAVQVTEQLDPVVRLDVVHPVAEHLQQGVKDSPGVGLEHVRQQLAWAGGGDVALVLSFCVKSISLFFYKYVCVVTRLFILSFEATMNMFTWTLIFKI